MIRHPQGVGSGERFQALTQPADFAPTILEMLGIEAPAAMGIQGRSLLPQMAGSTETHRPAAISGSFPSYTPPAGDPSVAGSAMSALTTEPGWTSLTVTGPEYALVAFPERERNELYHLPGDPGMTNNIVTKNRDRERELQRELMAFLETHESPEWLKRLYGDGPEGVQVPDIDDHLKMVRQRGLPLTGSLDGEVL